MNRTDTSSLTQKVEAIIESRGKTVKFVLMKRRLFDFFPLPPLVRWLWIEDLGDHFFVSVADGKTSSSCRVYAIDINKSTGKIERAYKTVVSLWEVKREIEIRQISNFVSRCIDLAFNEVSSEHKLSCSIPETELKAGAEA